MARRISIGFFVLLLQSGSGMTQEGGGFDDERRWLAEHPEALTALGSMSREELGQFFETYQDLSAEEKAQLRERAGELQQLSPEERSWALQNPDAVRELGAMPEADRQKVMETYRNLSPEEQQKLRERSSELRSLSSEEKKWVLENPDAARELGNVPDAERQQMIDTYRDLSPESQRMIRDRMGR